MKEVWKDITGYEGLYQVSNSGRVQSLPRENMCVNRVYIRKGKVLKGSPDKDGYLCVHLSKMVLSVSFLCIGLSLNILYLTRIILSK